MAAEVAVTDIEIANIALSDCGVDPIVKFTDNNARAKQMKSKYAAVRDMVLEAAEWSFALQQIQCAEDATTPLFQYSHSFIIPSVVIRVLRVYDSSGLPAGTPMPDTDWVRQGWRIFTNHAGPIFADTIQRVGEGSFSPTFVIALAAKLTAKTAIPLTENRALAKDFEDLYQSTLTDATSLDGKQGRMRKLRPTPLPGRQQNL